ncbi:hypothetical protein C8F04DRAFT_1192675 [Mycena alexandri]|uniref:Uncharacterized protein n=1 Tax=Mycena alexandri TaxID=1745969 RepID=A0AAD6SA96_9AGAR|nr:hypothetical protein C8F04DRAFT_1192675 [Mycena alexandri]
MTGNDLKIRRRGESEIRTRSAGKKNDEGRDPGNVLTKEAHHVKMICSQSRRREIKSWLGRRRGDLEKKPAPDKSLFAPTPHQYLSRDALNAPPAAAVALTTNDPAEIMTDAVARLWRKVTTGEPLVVSPSYAASPMMEYYGVVNFKDGTPAHLFSRLGNRTLMHDPANNKIHQSSGHELVYHFPAPVDPSELWKFEVPYPLDKNVHDTFFVLSDGFLAPDDVGFPMHATPVSPPMLPLEERLKGRSVRPSLICQRRNLTSTAQIAEYFTDVTTGSPMADSEAPTDNTASPVQDGRVTVDMREVSRQVLAGFRAPIRVDSDIVKKLDEEIDRERVRKLGEEIHARAQRALSTGSEGSIPALVSDYGSSTGSSGPTGVCELCGEGPHASAIDCTARPPGFDPVIVDAAEQAADEELAKQAEIQRTFDAAVAPILNELFQISGRQPVTVQQIFDVAREAQRTTQDFAVAFEKRRAEEEGKIVEIFEGEIARVLSTLPEDLLPFVDTRLFLYRHLALHQPAPAVRAL